MSDRFESVPKPALDAAIRVLSDLSDECPCPRCNERDLSYCIWAAGDDSFVRLSCAVCGHEGTPQSDSTPREAMYAACDAWRVEHALGRRESRGDGF